jgi:hypothetical protein
VAVAEPAFVLDELSQIDAGGDISIKESVK